MWRRQGNEAGSIKLRVELRAMGWLLNLTLVEKLAEGGGYAGSRSSETGLTAQKRRGGALPR